MVMYRMANISMITLDVLVAIACFVYIGILANTNTNAMYNSRTVHLEEYIEGFPVTTPQHFWGLIWPVKADGSHAGGHTLLPVSTDTCFDKTEDVTKVISPTNKRADRLCGPNLWHMHVSCPTKSGSDQSTLFQKYFDVLGYDWSKVDSDEKNYWLSKRLVANPNNKQELIESQESNALCSFSKIRPLTSFVTDSRSYSFIANGNLDAYMLTVISILCFGAVANATMRMKSSRKSYVEMHVSKFAVDTTDVEGNTSVLVKAFVYIVFFSVYVIFFVYWNRNSDSSSPREVTINTETYWYVNDSCYGAILIGWLAFSFFGWLVMSPTVNYRELTKNEKSPIDPDVIDPLKSEFHSLVTGKMLHLDADVQFRSAPIRTAELEDTDQLQMDSTVELHNLIAESNLFASTILFVLPFMTAAILSMRKFTMDIIVQKHIFGSVIVGAVAYLLIALTWVMQGTSNIHSNDKPNSMKISNWITFITNVVFALGMAVFGYTGYVFVWMVPYDSKHILGGIYILCAIVLGLAWITSSNLGFLGSSSPDAISIRNAMTSVYFLARLTLAILAIVIVMVHTDKGPKPDSIADKLQESDANSMKSLIWHYWVHGRSYQDPITALSYSSKFTEQTPAPTPAT